MSFLTEAQLQELATYMHTAVKRYEPLQEELLDHLACLVEGKMAEGLDFSTAKRHALACLDQDEVKRTEGKTLFIVHTKPVLMKAFVVLGCSCLISVATWLSVHTEARRPARPALVEQIQTADAAAPATAPVPDPPAIAPLEGQREITAAFGPRIHPVLKDQRLHRGVDFKAPMGTPILATADGTITFAKEEHLYGLKVVIRHDEAFESLYAHLSELKVKAGDQVKKGMVIGLVGNSGASSGPHLHYEVLKDGKPVNPADYLPKT